MNRLPVLKEQHRVFAEGILEGLNQTEAAKKAGYSEATVTGSRLMQREDVKEFLSVRQNKLAQRHNTTKDDIAAWCWDILELDPIEAMVRDEKGIMRIDLGAARQAVRRLSKSGAIEIVETRSGAKWHSTVKISGLAQLKQKALETLCRMYGFYDDKLEVKGEMNIAQVLQEGRNRVKNEG